MRVIFRIGFLSALISFSAFPEEKKTDKIEVIGNKDSAAGSAKGTKTDPGGFVDVIKSESFKDRYVSLPDVLEREAGVRVRRFGGLGSYSTLSIRGSNPNQVQIYIDGVPLSNAQGGEINLSDLNFDNLDRIEIHKSGSTSGMSSSSIGGSVNLITKKTDVSRKTRFSVSGGSFNTFKITGSKSGEYKDVKYSIFGQKEKSDQNFTFRSDNGTPVLNTFDDFDTKRRNAQFDRYSLTGTLAFGAGKTDVSVLNDFNWRRNGIPGPGNNQTKKTDREYIRNTTSLNTVTKELFSGRMELGSRVFYTGVRDHLFDPLSEFSSGTPDSKADIQQYGVHLLPTVYWKEASQTFRFLLANEKETFRRDKRNAIDQLIDKGTRKFRNHTVLQMQDEISLLKGRLILAPSVQKEIYTDRFNENTIPVPLDVTNLPKHRKITDYNIYRFSILGSLHKTDSASVSWKTNISQEKRIPSFLELFGERGSILGNASLKPERSRNADTGPVLEYKTKDWNIRNTNSFYYKKIEDMILFVPNSQFSLRPENVDRADIRGMEWSVKFNLKEKWKFSSTYTYQKAVNISDVSYLNGKYLPLRPLHEWYGLAAYKFSRAEIGFEPTFIGASFRDRSNEYVNYQPSRWIYSLYFNWSVYKTEEKELSVNLDLRNILDTRAYDIIGYPLPGRMFYLTVSGVF